MHTLYHKKFIPSKHKNRKVLSRVINKKIKLNENYRNEVVSLNNDYIRMLHDKF